MNGGREVAVLAALKALTTMEREFIAETRRDGLTGGEALSEWFGIVMFAARGTIDRFNDPSGPTASAIRTLTESRINESIQ